MGKFANTLVKVRKDSGYKSARSFYEALQSSGAEFDYSYYTRIEKGDLLPSSKIVSTITGRLKEASLKEGLIKAFCSEQFPEFTHLFPEAESQKFDPELMEGVSNAAFPILLKKQQFLSLQQTKMISLTKHHYFIYLLITLARRPLSLEECSNTTGLNFDHCEKILKDLLKVKVLVNKEGQIDSFVKESHFPKRSDYPSLAETYSRLDEWDLEFGNQMNFKLLKKKFSLRRISPRSLPVILQITDGLIKLLEISDDSRDERNSLVISFSQQIKVGKLPG